MNNTRSLTRPHKVLVVDDDVMLCEYLCVHLNSREIDTVCAHNLRNAEEIIGSDKAIDLVVLDYHLGSELGIDFISSEQYLRLLEKPPIIMISSSDDSQFLEDCFSRGVSDFILKPINFLLFVLKVDILLKTIVLRRLNALQHKELTIYKESSEREEEVARFTYEYLLKNKVQDIQGITFSLKPFSAFSGDISVSKYSPSGNLIFMLADATGHGLSAAITILPVVTTFNSMVSKGFQVSKIVSEINKRLTSDIPDDKFVAAIVIDFDPHRKTMSVWNGAMPPAYWVCDGKINHRFHSRTMALGILGDEVFDASCEIVDIPEEGYLFVNSDGVNEQKSKNNELFSLKRIEKILEGNVRHIVENLWIDLEEHAGADVFDDDVSICVLEPKKFLCSDVKSSRSNNGVEVYSDGALSWVMKVSGEKLARCELPIICNKVLQELDVDHGECQKIFSIVSELVSNGLEHGVLGLSSELKASENGFLQYYEEREARLSRLTSQDYIEIRISSLVEGGVKKTEIVCRDSGSGFDFNKKKSSQLDLHSGRGMLMIKGLSEAVVIEAPGNTVRVIL